MIWFIYNVYIDRKWLDIQMQIWNNYLSLHISTEWQYSVEIKKFIFETRLRWFKTIPVLPPHHKTSGKLLNISMPRKSEKMTVPEVPEKMTVPYTIYGCESYTMNKAEHQRIYSFELWCWRRLFRVPWTPRTSNPKGINSKCWLEGLILKL